MSTSFFKLFFVICASMSLIQCGGGGGKSGSPVGIGDINTGVGPTVEATSVDITLDGMEAAASYTVMLLNEAGAVLAQEEVQSSAASMVLPVTENQYVRVLAEKVTAAGESGHSLSGAFNIKAKKSNSVFVSKATTVATVLAIADGKSLSQAHAATKVLNSLGSNVDQAFEELKAPDQAHPNLDQNKAVLDQVMGGGSTGTSGSSGPVASVNQVSTPINYEDNVRVSHTVTITNNSDQDKLFALMIGLQKEPQLATMGTDSGGNGEEEEKKKGTNICLPHSGDPAELTPEEINTNIRFIKSITVVAPISYCVTTEAGEEKTCAVNPLGSVSTPKAAFDKAMIKIAGKNGVSELRKKQPVINVETSQFDQGLTWDIVDLINSRGELESQGVWGSGTVDANSTTQATAEVDSNSMFPDSSFTFEGFFARMAFAGMIDGMFGGIHDDDPVIAPPVVTPIAPPQETPPAILEGFTLPEYIPDPSVSQELWGTSVIPSLDISDQGIMADNFDKVEMEVAGQKVDSFALNINATGGVTASASAGDLASFVGLKVTYYYVDKSKGCSKIKLGDQLIKQEQTTGGGDTAPYGHFSAGVSFKNHDWADITTMFVLLQTTDMGPGKYDAISPNDTASGESHSISLGSNTKVTITRQNGNETRLTTSGLCFAPSSLGTSGSYVYDYTQMHCFFDGEFPSDKGGKLSAGETFKIGIHYELGSQEFEAEISNPDGENTFTFDGTF